MLNYKYTYKKLSCKSQLIFLFFMNYIIHSYFYYTYIKFLSHINALLNLIDTYMI